MANAKRASMREGPLAALFRKTEDQDSAEQPEMGGSAATPDATAEAHAAPQTPAASAASPPSVESTPQGSLPHPALSPSPEVREEPVRIPSPQERLRHAFSSEIPENVLERPSSSASPSPSPSPSIRQGSPSPTGSNPTGLPAMDVYAREDRRSSFGSAAPVAQPVIRVVGVGGAGTNAVNRMVEAEVVGVEFLAINTDLQSLQQSTADMTLHIGAELTRGLGSGSDANLGRQSAMDDYDRIKALLKGSDMIFITAGAGGGTGTGAAPIVARIAREVGALTVAIVTKPFGFEGSRRGEQAEQGVRALAEEVDTLIVVPNNRLLSVLDKQTAMVEAFRVADDVLRQGVQGISDLVTLPGLINLDFADVRTIMSEAGNALLGIGMGVGENRATDAAMQAVSSPLLETSMEGARSILLSITGGRDLSLWEVNEAAKAVAAAAHPDANIIFGAMVDEKLDDQVWVTVVATGYGSARITRPATRSRLEEPAGEPRVQRAGAGVGAVRRERAEFGERRGGSLAVGELEVPEFIPNL
jgi:cell division protein FtsZ